ncbi:MAG: phosphate signaling complex protein PhoU [Acidobacteriota bacterium]
MSRFDQELQRIQREVLDLGLRVENVILESVKILQKHDLDAARQLIAYDSRINGMRFTIEHDTLVLIATHQPVAVDLRSLAAVLEIATELERIGDYGKGIARIVLKIGDKPLVKPLLDIPRMAVKASDMLHRALEAFMAGDATSARALSGEDEEMDGLYNQIYRELMTYVIADPKLIESANYLIWVAHNLERTADRVMNICERIIFTVTGEMLELDS